MAPVLQYISYILWSWYILWPQDSLCQFPPGCNCMQYPSENYLNHEYTAYAMAQYETFYTTPKPASALSLRSLLRLHLARFMLDIEKAGRFLKHGCMFVLSGTNNVQTAWTNNQMSIHRLYCSTPFAWLNQNGPKDGGRIQIHLWRWDALFASLFKAGSDVAQDIQCETCCFSHSCFYKTTCTCLLIRVPNDFVPETQYITCWSYQCNYSALWKENNIKHLWIHSDLLRKLCWLTWKVLTLCRSGRQEWFVRAKIHVTG